MFHFTCVAFNVLSWFIVLRIQSSAILGIYSTCTAHDLHENTQSIFTWVLLLWDRFPFNRFYSSQRTKKIDPNSSLTNELTWHVNSAFFPNRHTNALYVKHKPFFKLYVRIFCFDPMLLCCTVRFRHNVSSSAVILFHE